MKILKFGAIWCPGCLVMRSIWTELEREYPWLETESFDFNQDKEKFNQLEIGKTLPVLIFMDKDNQEFLRLAGERSKKELEKLIIENKGR